MVRLHNSTRICIPHNPTHKKKCTTTLEATPKMFPKHLSKNLSISHKTRQYAIIDIQHSSELASALSSMYSVFVIFLSFNKWASIWVFCGLKT
ncbi:hypothetical protein ACJIZ3_015748 [Penstemon smallii]|uniref:Uncharacterized protein n=1 Tax=Penstemon smallii TaxID=265156 RepID=A0ABD3RNI4_9LAMI